MGDLVKDADAARRIADVLLRNAHGRGVMLRLPAPATPNSAAEQLGLAVPVFEDVELAPVIFRKARARLAAGKPAQFEMLVSATAVVALVADSGVASASALFASAYGVLVDDALLTIVSLSEMEAGGVICGYRLLLREAASLEV